MDRFDGHSLVIKVIMVAPRKLRAMVVLVIASLFASAILTGQSRAGDPFAEMTFESMEDALGVGLALVRAKKLNEAKGPLETALKMSSNDEQRMKCYQALLPVYRKSPDLQPFRDAAEFMIRKATKEYERSSACSALISFAHNRSETQTLIQHYEAQLKATPDDEPAIYILSELYSSDRDHPERAVEIQKAWLKLVDAGKSLPLSPIAKDAAVKRLYYAKNDLARFYTSQSMHDRAAKLHEEIAPEDASTESYHLLQAAAQWLKADDQEKARECALRAEKLPPDSRDGSLPYYFHRGLGEALVAVGEAEKALAQFQMAIKKSTVAQDIDATKKLLEDARKQSSKAKK
jgi:hypothetical protein